MHRGLVTVMVPSYNYAQYLTECVESAVGQRNVDVAIVDNGSTDGSPELGMALAESHANVRFKRYEDNQGIIASFNRCVEEVRGEYTILLCADDCLTPGSVARSVEFMDAHPKVGLVYGTAVDFTRLEDIRPEQLEGEVRPPVVYPGERWVERLCRAGNNPIRNPESMFRSAYFEQLGPYDPACPYTSDLNLFLRIAATSDVGYLRGPAQALFRRHQLAHGVAYPHFSLAEVEQRWAAYAKFFEYLGDDPRRASWERMARRHSGNEARYAASRAFVRRTPDQPDAPDLALLQLADEIDPRGPSLIESVGWSLRRWLGPDRSRWFPGFLPRPALRRAKALIDERRRIRKGIG